MNILIKLLIPSLILFSGVAEAISEKNYSNEMHEKVIPFLEAHLKTSEFKSRDGHNIFYGILNVHSSKGTIVISPGRTESLTNYREWIYDFAQAGYSVGIIDHRGQGKSVRFVLDSDVGHVDRFSDYLADFEDFYQTHVLPKTNPPHHLFAVSMGATIGALYMIDHPRKFHSAAFVAPMIKLKLDPVPEILVKQLAKLLSWFGWSKRYAPSVGPFDKKRPFEKNQLTHSRERYEFDMASLLKDEKSIIGGASVGWVREAIAATSDLRSRAGGLSDPVILFQASDDSFVELPAQTQFCNDAVNCQSLFIAESKHCLQIETDEKRNRMLLATLKFFSAHN